MGLANRLHYLLRPAASKFHGSLSMIRFKHRDAGFSLIELIIVIAVIGIVAAFALINIFAILPGYRADQAMNQVFSQLRAARQLAISQRREVQVQFTGTGTIQVTEIELVGANVVFPPVTWEGGVQYYLMPAVPDTPMAFGNCAAVCLENLVGGPPTMKFTPSGTFIDAGNTLVDGTIFLGTPGNPMTARAITILGATGRIRQYHWNGTTWQE